jgi:hypothetical protein
LARWKQWSPSAWPRLEHYCERLAESWQIPRQDCGAGYRRNGNPLGIESGDFHKRSVRARAAPALPGTG